MKFVLMILVLNIQFSKAQTMEGNICDTIIEMEKCYLNYNKSIFEAKKFKHYVGLLEKRTKILSQATKDIDGYHYQNDQLFYDDLKKWRLFLGCSSNR